MVLVVVWVVRQHGSGREFADVLFVNDLVAFLFLASIFPFRACLLLRGVLSPLAPGSCSPVTDAGEIQGLGSSREMAGVACCIVNALLGRPSGLR